MSTTTPPTTSARHSLWLDADRPATAYPPPDLERSFDVLVLGAGIVGLTTALLLKRAGARVAVVDAARTGSGVTGHSTAKVTALQSTMLTRIARTRGEEAAQEYARLNAAAVKWVATTTTDAGIDCALQRRPAYTVAVTAAALPAVEHEVELASTAGLPVEFTTDVPLPYPVAGAARLDDQLEFHPVRYARGLAAAVHGSGSAVFEHTRATGVHERSPVQVETTAGPLTADRVVVTTHVPVWDRGGYFARMQAHRWVGAPTVQDRRRFVLRRGHRTPRSATLRTSPANSPRSAGTRRRASTPPTRLSPSPWTMSRPHTRPRDRDRRRRGS